MPLPGTLQCQCQEWLQGGAQANVRYVQAFMRREDSSVGPDICGFLRLKHGGFCSVPICCPHRVATAVPVTYCVHPIGCVARCVCYDRKHSRTVQTSLLVS